MRELRVCPDDRRWKATVVGRLQFDPGNAKLVASVGFTASAPYALRVCDLRSGESQYLHDQQIDEDTMRPVVSRDLRLIAGEFIPDPEISGGWVKFFDTANPNEYLPPLESCPDGCGGVAFSPDAEQLVAVLNRREDGEFEPEVASCPTAPLTQPPTGFRTVLNRLTGRYGQVPIRKKIAWRSILRLPRAERATAVALSESGRLLAVGGEEGTVHVVDLKKKRVSVSFPWEGRRVQGAARVGFDPAERRVVLLANGRLFTRPLAEGKPWHTKSTLGFVHDFAFHPSGQSLCAVFADGHARYLDPTTGDVRTVFRWEKKPLYSVAFSPDGLLCAAGGEKGRVVVWDVDS